MEEPTVYETSDIDSDIEVQAPPKPHEDIIEDDIEYGTSFRRFNSEFVAGKVNFNYASDIPLNEAGFKVFKHESDAQKLQRITKELEELKATESLKEKQTEKFDHLIKLAQELKSNPQKDITNFKSQLSELFEPLQLPADENKQGDLTPQKTGLQDFQIIEIDKRISELEAKFAGISSPIGSTLNTLERKINIINNPEYNLDQVQKSINALLESPQVGKLKSSNLDAVKHEKIDQLIKYAPELQEYCKTSHLLKQRMKALNDVHMRSLELGEFVSNLQMIVENMSRDMTRWDKNLDEINKKIDHSIDKFDENRQQIENWVDQLNEKIENRNS